MTLKNGITTIGLAIFILGGYSCQEDGSSGTPATPATPRSAQVEKSEPVDSAEIVASDAGVQEMEAEIESLEAENKKEEQTVEYLNKKVKSLNSENDSLNTVIHHKNDIIDKLAESKKEDISDTELYARAFIQDVNMAWKMLPGAKDNTVMTKHFLPSYGVSMVRVGLEEQAQVGMLYPEEFEKKLTEIRKRENLSLQVGNVKFLYFDGVDDVYTVVYKAVFRIYEDDIPTSDRNIVATVTMKRVDGTFKIGKYSWVSMGHEF